jgi:hypothetical protein
MLNQDSFSSPAWLSNIAQVLQERPYATIFGSSIRGKGDPEIEYWSTISIHLANQGWGILSGGYQGTMSYLSNLHILNGGHSIGVTCSAVCDPVTEDCFSQLVQLDSPFSRLEALLRLSQVHIVFPGGIGTLVELSSSVWLQDRNMIDKRPLLILGDEWLPWLDWFAKIPNALRGTKPLNSMVMKISTREQFDVVLAQLQRGEIM